MAAIATYSDIRSQLRTGDLLIFEGSALLDVMINLLEDGDYSHVGMVLKDPEGRLWFWDAPGGGDQFFDPYYAGQAKHAGTRVAELDGLLQYYMTMEGKTFTWRKLESPAISDEQYEALVTNFIKPNLAVKFPGDGAVVPQEIEDWFTTHFPQAKPELDTAIGLLLSYLTGCVLRLPVTESFFCAQLVAATYQYLQLLPAGNPLPPNGYAPANFDDQPQPLQLAPGVRLAAGVPVMLGPQVNGATG